MIIDCARYQDGHRTDEGAMPLEEAAARAAQGGFVWLGLFEPTQEELAQVRDTFGLNPLAVEDAISIYQRPKIEDYEGDVRLVIVPTTRHNEDAEHAEYGQLAIFVASTFVITVRQGVPSRLHEARQRLEQRPELLAAGTSSALWAILDQVLDDYFTVVTWLDRYNDEIRDAVLVKDVVPPERIWVRREETKEFYRTFHPLLAVVATIEPITAVPELRTYLRDLHHHLLVIDEMATDQLDLLSTVLDFDIAISSLRQAESGLRQNSTIQKLTILATIFLPLTFISGFFGPVFGWHIRDVPTYTAFIVYGLAVLVLPLVLLFWLWWARMPRTGRG
jgi:magnesium transporter